MSKSFLCYFPSGEPDPQSDKDKEQMKVFVNSFISSCNGTPLSFEGLHLYRARYEDFEDNHELSQYGYIPDSKIQFIKRQRYNLPREQVLYLSTNPLIAYREIETNNNSSTHFFLSVWQRIPNTNKPVLFPVIPYNREQLKGTALKYYNSVATNINKSNCKSSWLKDVGMYLESTSKSGMNNGYLLSSAIAHNLFKNNDVLLTVSQKSDNSELNMTFNNKAYDFVQIKEIYHCKCPDNSSTPLFEVDKIGFPQENKVVWFNYEIDIDTISSINDNSGQCAKAKQLLQTNKQNIKIKMSVIKTKDYYNFIVIDNREKYMFKSKIILKAVNAE